jgi:uncharacterized protein YrrD
MKIVGTLIAAASLVVCLAGGLASPATVPELGEHLATRLIGKTIENQDALQLGKLKDFIIEADTGKPLYAVVSSGGLAGLKPRRSLVPAPALSQATAKRSVLYVDVPSKKWQEAPVFKKNELVKLGKHDVIRQIYTFYDVGDPPAENASAKPGASRLTRTGPERSAGTTSDVTVQRASEVIGEPVFDSDREKLGNISDLLFDLSGGNPTMAVISAKSLLKASECFAVPFRSMVLSKENKLVVSHTRASLEKALLLNERTWGQAGSRDTLYRCPAR